MQIEHKLYDLLTFSGLSVLSLQHLNPFVTFDIQIK